MLDHMLEYGTKSIKAEKLYLFQGFDPSNANVIHVQSCESGSMFEGMMSEDLNIWVTTASNANENSWGTYFPGIIMASEVINQIDVDLLFMWKMYEQLDDNSKKKTEILEEITATTKHRLHLDSSVDFIRKLVFGSTDGPSILDNIRSSGQPLVDDWDCLKSMVRVFESHCGSLT